MAAVTETTTETAASDKADTDKAAADKVAADKAAADTAAATAAAAGKTPEQLAAEKKPAADTETARKAADQAKAPEKYELTLPENGRLEASDLEVVAAEAKALGLTQAQAQQLVTTRATALTALSDQFLTDLKADPELGGAHFDTTVKHALAGRDWLFPPGSEEAALVTAWFEKTGLGNHKAFVRALARVGKARAEDRPVSGAGLVSGGERKPTTDVLFPSTAKASA
jgi:hypothetical protein